jgi:Co/Zn/Cd efflux system component
MGQSCCENKKHELVKLRESQAKVLKIVLAINAIMFFVEFSFGYISKSSALMADSLDMFGDAAVYAFSLYALHKAAIWRSRAGLAKGIIMALLGMFILGEVFVKIIMGTVPEAQTMTLIGTLALAANTACVILLFKHRSDDINLRSTWLCSRNDIIANISVLTASGLVAITGSAIPDIAVGLGIAFLFLRSAHLVIREALAEITTFKLESSSGVNAH